MGTHIISHLDLADGHPFKVCSDSVHLTLVHRDPTVFDERSLGVVELRRAVTVGVICDLVVIPDRDPWEVLVASNQIQVGTVCGVALAVIIKRIDLSIWQWDTTNSLSPAVIAISVFVDIVTKVKNVVDGVLADWISVGVEEAEWVVAAGVDGQVDSSCIVGSCRSCLGSAHHAGYSAIADGELVVIPSEWLKVPGLHFDGVVNIGACVHCALVEGLGQSFVTANFPVQAYRRGRRWLSLIGIVVDGHRVVERDIATGCAIALDVVGALDPRSAFKNDLASRVPAVPLEEPVYALELTYRRTSCPQNHAIWERIA